MHLVCENCPFFDFFAEGEYSKEFKILAMKSTCFYRLKNKKNDEVVIRGNFWTNCGKKEEFFIKNPDKNFSLGSEHVKG